MTAYLAEALQAHGWTVHTPQGPFTKSDWQVDFDTSHWQHGRAGLNHSLHRTGGVRAGFRYRAVTVPAGR